MERPVAFPEILVALCQKSCIIPFFTEETEISSQCTASIANGKGTIHAHKLKGRCQPETFTKEARYENDRLDGNDIDRYRAQMVMIARHILEAVGSVFSSTPFDVVLEFGVEEDSNRIWLLRSSSCAVMVDPVEFEFQEFFLKEIAKPLGRKRCQIGKRDCGNPSFVVPQSSVLLYRTSRRFTQFNKTTLRKMIRARQMDPEPMCYVCVRCISLLQADVACAKRGKTRVLPIHELHPLVPADKGLRRGVMSRGIGADPSMQRNCSFALNLENSPYKEPLRLPKRPEPAVYERVKPLARERPEDIERVMTISGYRPRTPGPLPQRPKGVLNLNTYKLSHKTYAQQLDDAVSTPKRRKSTKSLLSASLRR